MKVKMNQENGVEHTTFNEESNDKCKEIHHLRKLLR